MKLRKRVAAVVMAAAMLIGLLPMKMGIVSAQNTEVYPTTWAELRDALQSSDVLNIKIPTDVKIIYTFDSAAEDYRDVQINVVGKKNLYIYGRILFHNSLNNGKGLINLNSSDDELNVYGSSNGILFYDLGKGDSLAQGDLFYLTAGSLYLSGNVSYKVAYESPGETVEAHQAVIGGTGGDAVIWTSTLYGNTIFGDGVNFTFKNAFVRGYWSRDQESYLSVDLYMRKGHATFIASTFRRGIGWEGNADSLMSMAEGTVCVDLSGTDSDADKDYILKNTPCAFHSFGFGVMEPEMPETGTSRSLGTIGVGETKEIHLWTTYQNSVMSSTSQLYDKARIELYRDGDKIQSETMEGCNQDFTYTFENAQAGYYEMWITLSLINNGVAIKTETYRYTLTVTDTIRNANVSLDKTDMNGLKGDGIVDVSNITWYEKNRTTGVWTEDPASIRDGFTYAVEFKLVSIGGKYAFADDYKVYVNGEEATRTDGGKWRIEYTKTGYLTRIEMYDIALPAPGQHPDFTGHKDNPPYADYEIVWTPFVNGEYGEALTADDVFEDNTNYMLEIVLTAHEDFEFDYYTDDNGAYAYINDKTAKTYYPGPSDRTKIVAYTYYNTSYCVSEIEVIDVQYPIPGKTPDTDVIVKGHAKAVAYADGSKIDWYYETNPGTSGAGFSKLDGKFKADRRHQAYVKLQTDSGYWFATDSQGKSAVSVLFDGQPMAFAYVTDTDTRYGYNEIEAACTFEIAKTVDGVFIDGMWLQDGLYMDSKHYGVHTEDSVDKEAGYVYYENGTLTLHDFQWRSTGDYDAIDAYHPLTIKAEGQNRFNDDLEYIGYGIVTSSSLTLCGDGEVVFSTDNSALFTMGEVTVESGKWQFWGDTYDGIWLGDDLTVNGGSLDVYGNQCALYGDDYPTVTVNGGKLYAYTDSDCAIGWCDLRVADGVTVGVKNHRNDANFKTWDGKTSLNEYGAVLVASPEEEPTILYGDVDGNGQIKMNDAMQVFYHVAKKIVLEGEKFIRADVDSNGSVKMNDAMKVFYYVAKKIDAIV